MYPSGGSRGKSCGLRGVYVGECGAPQPNPPGEIHPHVQALRNVWASGAPDRHYTILP
jgi:hypothetical protein